MRRNSNREREEDSYLCSVVSAVLRRRPPAGMDHGVLVALPWVGLWSALRTFENLD